MNGNGKLCKAITSLQLPLFCLLTLLNLNRFLNFFNFSILSTHLLFFGPENFNHEGHEAHEEKY